MKNAVIALLVIGIGGGVATVALVSGVEIPDPLKDIFNWSKEILWGKYIFGFFEDVWEKTEEIVSEEAEKRKPLIEQELEEEKQEIKEDVRTQGSKVWQNLWSRFKTLF